MEYCLRKSCRFGYDDLYPYLRCLTCFLTISSVIVIIGFAPLTTLLMMPRVSAFGQENQFTTATTEYLGMITVVSLSAYDKQNTGYSNTYKACPAIIDVDPGSMAYNKTAINCAGELIKNCDHSNLHLLYSLGSLTISIQGKIYDSLCSVKLLHDLEMGQKRYDCVVPFNKLAAWMSWNKSDGIGAVNDILSVCRVVR